MFQVRIRKCGKTFFYIFETGKKTTQELLLRSIGNMATSELSVKNISLKDFY